MAVVSQKFARFVAMAFGVLGFVSILVGVVASPAAAATGSWSTPVNLSAAGGNAQSPQISVDAAGNAIAVWHRGDGGNDVVQTSSSTDGGVTWSTAVDLSAAGVIAKDPQVSVDATGTTIAVWTGWNAGTDVVQSRSSTDGGVTWSTPVDIYAGVGTAYNSQISVDAAGTAYAIWYRWNGNNDIVQFASSTDGGVTWSIPVDLSAIGGTAVGPKITVDAVGTVIVAWIRNDSSNFIVQSRSSTDGGVTWSTPTANLSAIGGDAGRPSISAVGNGKAIAVWTGDNGAVQSASSSDGGLNWSTPVDVSTADGYAEDSQVTVDAAGNAIAIWRRDDASNNNVQSASSSDGGVTWSIPVDVSAADDSAGSPQVSLGAAGRVFAIWRGNDGSDSIVQFASSSDGGVTWSSPADLSAAGGDGVDPQISVDADGNVFAIWRRYDGSDNIVQTSFLAFPSLADTGTATGATTASLGIAAGLLGVGAVALVIVRRRLAHE
jgi:hypothetical protein